MSSPPQKKLRTSHSSNGSMGLDRISDLPGNVVDQILSCLPIKDATKTSILSRKWRFKYIMLPNLVFDDRSFPFEEYVMTIKPVRVVDHVLLLHCGPIRKFELSFRYRIPNVEIERWILYLLRHQMQLQVFTLKMPLRMSFGMPSYMFSFQNLRCLRLNSCVLKPPSTFKGFKNLMYLYLKDVVVHRDVLESLISGSPLLEKFDYDGPYADHYLHIEAPNLLGLRIVTNNGHVNLSLKNTPRIQKFMFEAKVYVENHITEKYLEGLLACMPRLKFLTLGHGALKLITHGEVSGEFPVTLVHLHHLMMHTKLTDVKETSFLLRLLRSASNLQQLSICAIGSESLEASIKGWESDSSNRSFTNLRYIKINTFRATKAEIDFIGFMLSNSLALEEMVINFHAETIESLRYDGHKAVTVTSKLLSFRRGSPKATVILLDK